MAATEIEMERMTTSARSYLESRGYSPLDCDWRRNRGCIAMLDPNGALALVGISAIDFHESGFGIEPTFDSGQIENWVRAWFEFHPGYLPGGTIRFHEVQFKPIAGAQDGWYLKHLHDILKPQ